MDGWLAPMMVELRLIMITEESQRLFLCFSLFFLLLLSFFFFFFLLFLTFGYFFSPFPRPLLARSLARSQNVAILLAVLLVLAGLFFAAKEYMGPLLEWVQKENPVVGVSASLRACVPACLRACVPACLRACVPAWPKMTLTFARLLYDGRICFLHLAPASTIIMRPSHPSTPSPSHFHNTRNASIHRCTPHKRLHADVHLIRASRIF